MSQQNRVPTPDAVPGRKHAAFQTELYLEELELSIPQDSISTQTDAFLDRAPSPVYIPVKSGVDASTQIYDGELFDFDMEVEPILEVLVGKVIEQSLMEVLEEEELRALKNHQIMHEKKRNAELAEVQRLEHAEKRRQEEKERRIAEQERFFTEQKAAAEKISAQTFAQNLLRDIVPNVFDALTTNGFFYDAVEREVETVFLSNILDSSTMYMEKTQSVYALVDGTFILFL